MIPLKSQSCLIFLIFYFSIFAACSAVNGGSSIALSSKTIDHVSVNINDIPSSAVQNAKNTLHIAYGHTSHGSQLVDGMSGLAAWKGPLYDWNNGDTGGAALDLRDNPFSGASDLGNPDFTSWAAATSNYLASGPGVNVVIWSWCGEVSGASETDINTYLGLMSQLESVFPAVVFVYMTGHLDGSGLTGNLHQRNNQIRNYCRDNNKWLFDFEDIESYDPDGIYYGDKYPTDGCNYDYNNSGGTTQTNDPALPTEGDTNWAMVWQDSHIMFDGANTNTAEWYSCGSAHTQPLNANRKAYAAWRLWCRIAGWAGI